MPYSPKWSAAMLVITATSALRDREPAPQDSAARGLEHGRLDARVAQHPPRAGGPE